MSDLLKQLDDIQDMVKLSRKEKVKKSIKLFVQRVQPIAKVQSKITRKHFKFLAVSLASTVALAAGGIVVKKQFFDKPATVEMASITPEQQEAAEKQTELNLLKSQVTQLQSQSKWKGSLDLLNKNEKFLNNSNISLLMARSRAHRNLKNYSQALLLLDEADQLFARPKKLLILERAQVHLDQQQRAEAIEVIVKSKVLDKGASISELQLLASLYEAEKQWQSAMLTYAKILENRKLKNKKAIYDKIRRLRTVANYQPQRRVDYE